MPCLACDAPTAETLWGATGDLADVLCLEHLLDALEAPAGTQRAVRPDLRGRCWGKALTCPRPATRPYPNGQWCDVCGPLPPVGVRRWTPSAPLVRTAHTDPDDEGMSDAALAVLNVFDGVRLEVTPTYGEPEGS